MNQFFLSIFLAPSLLCFAATDEVHHLDYVPEMSEPVIETVTEGTNEMPGPRLIDLHDLSQDFILETKEIKIAEYPWSFNPTLIRWKERLLLCFRIRGTEKGVANRIGLVWLNEHLDPISSPTILEFRLTEPYGQHDQDPRLVEADGRLFMVHCNFLAEGTDRPTRRVFYSEVHQIGDSFYVENPESIIEYPHANPLRWEKNWIPFEFEKKLLLAYSITPHRILLPIRGEHRAEFFAESNAVIDWPWGVLRGGTQALLDGDEYISFFHSSINMPSVHSEGKVMQHYFMGAYTFSAKPPFEVLRVSPEPIVATNFYNAPPYKTWKPLRVVFPCGLVIDGDTFLVSYGRQDFEMWIAKIDKQKLFKSLIPTKQNQESGAQ